MEVPIRVINGLVIFEELPSSHKTYTFARGIYGGLKVIILNELGYINVSKLCKAGGKKYSNWLRNKGSVEMVEAYGECAQSLTHQATISFDNIDNDLKGVYMCRRLVIHVASWVSIDFGKRVSDIVDEYLAREAKTLLKVKDDKIDELQRTLEEIKEQNRVMCNMLETTNNNFTVTLDDLAITNDKLDIIKEDNTLIKKKLNIAVVDRVIQPLDEHLRSTFLLARLDDCEFYVIRAQSMNVEKALDKKSLTSDDVILRLECLPNAANLWLKIKEKISYIIPKGNRFILTKKSERRLIRDIKKINNEKLDVSLESEAPKKIIQVEVSLEERLNRKSNVDLRALCRDRKIIGFSKLDKRALIELLMRDIERKGL